MSAFDRKRGKAEERVNYAREAMRRKRADRWRAFVAAGPPSEWFGALDAVVVWARSSVLVLYRNVAGRAALCGGGGDEFNLDDDAPTGLFPQAAACARAANALVQPGQVEVFAAILGGLRPDEVRAFAEAAKGGAPVGLDLVTGELPERRGKRSLARLLGVQE